MENKKKILIAGDNALSNAKLRALAEKHGKSDSIEFVDVEALLGEGTPIADLMRPREDVLRDMPPIKINNHYRDLEAYDEFKYSHLTKKQREADIQPVRTEPKIGRNESCPCNSGKKYKNCCLNKK